MEIIRDLEHIIMFMVHNNVISIDCTANVGHGKMCPNAWIIPLPFKFVAPPL